MPEITITCVVSNPKTMSKFTPPELLDNVFVLGDTALQSNTITAEAVN
jgi:hypothetical protein